MLRGIKVRRAAQCVVVAGVIGVLGWSAGPAAGALPDHRAYELVSPPDKNGGDVLQVSSRTQAAADGDAAVFASLTGSGDTKGGTLATEYMAVRTAAPGTNGWRTHGISPQQPPLTFFGALLGQDPHYEGQMAPDLSRGVFRAYRPLGPAPNVADVENFYVRDDLRTPGMGSYQLVSDAPILVDPGPSAKLFPVKPVVAGTSADFSVVAFESNLNLVPEASGTDVKLYESINGRLMLAGVLPDGTPAPSSQAGRSAITKHFTSGAVSPDGSRVFFQAPAVGSGGIYMRVDGKTTVELSHSEKATPEAPGAGELWTVSKDGSRVFFTTSEGLVDGVNDGLDLYMYDVNGTPGHHLTQAPRDPVNGDPIDGVLTVIGASDDGHYLYFVGARALGERGLYLWHDGAVRWVGDFVDDVDARQAGLDLAQWGFIARTPDSRVSPDGRHLLFMTRYDDGFVGHGGFRGYDHGSRCTFDDTNGLPCRELYVYNDDTGQLRCVSCNPSGAAATTEAFANIVAGANSNTGPTSHLSHALSDSGRWVFFSTREALVPEDINGRFDAYEYDTSDDSVHLLSTGRSVADSFFLDASASGRDVFIATRDQLVGWDVDTSYDLYDARVDGGLPEPTPTLPACSGEACQGALGAVPPVSRPASSGFRGHGRVHEKLRKHHAKKHGKTCRRGTRRVVRKGKVRCVRRKAVSSGTGGFTYRQRGAR